MHSAHGVCTCKCTGSPRLMQLDGGAIKELGPQFKAVSIQCIRGSPLKEGTFGVLVPMKNIPTSQHSMDGTCKKKKWMLAGVDEESKQLQRRAKPKQHTQAVKVPNP